MTFLDLHYDIVSNIFLMLDSHSLLNLACTSRRLRDIVIPSFLFVHVNFGSLYRGSAIERLERFCHRIIDDDDDNSTSDVVRSFALEGALQQIESLLALALCRMSNIRDLRILGVDYLSPTYLPPALASLIHLDHLHLTQCSPLLLKGIREMASLRSLVISGRLGSHCVVKPAEGIGKALLTSRSTLVSLTMNDMTWDLACAPADVSDFSWPHVHTLNLRSTSVYGTDEKVDLSRIFPSVRSFLSPVSKGWARESQNIPFITSLENFEGTWDEMNIALPAFVNLRRASIRYSPLPSRFTFKHYLPATLQSLAVIFDRDFMPQYLDELPEVVPNLQFLLLTFGIVHERHLSEIAPKLRACISRLPLAFVIFKCDSVATIPRTAVPPDLTPHWESLFSSSVLDPPSTLQAISVKISPHQREWKREPVVETPLMRQFMELSKQ